MCGAKVKGKNPTSLKKQQLLKQKEQDMKKNYGVSEDTENVKTDLLLKIFVCLVK